MSSERANTFEVINTNISDVDVNFAFSQTFNTAFLENPSQYTVAITKADIPVDRVETFTIADNSRYWIGMRGPSIGNNTPEDLTTLREYLPTDKDDTDPNVFNGYIKYYSPVQMLNVMSRAINRAYCRFLATYSSSSRFESAYTNCLFRRSSEMSAPGKSFTSTINVTMLDTSLRTAYVQLIIRRLGTSQTPIADSSGNDVPPLVVPGVITITLSSPTNSIILYTGATERIDLYKYTNRDILFDDGGYQSAYGTLSQSASTKPTHHYTSPTESFSKFNGIDPNGNWTLNITSSTDTYGMFTWKLNVYTTQTKFPYSAPFLEIGDQNKINMVYEPQFMLAGYRVVMSPTMKTMLDFGPQYHRRHVNSFNPSQVDYEFICPDTIFKTDMSNVLVANRELITTSQNRPHLYSLSNILRILISSSSLSCSGDFIGGNNTLSTSTNLADFTLDLSNDSLSNLQYSTDASIRPWRDFNIRNTSPLTTITAIIEVEYINGLKYLLVQAPNTTTIIRLSFFPL